MTDNSMMMPDLGGLTCKEMVELVTDYLEGALPTDVRARFDQHLTVCDPCVVYVDQMRQTIAALGCLPEESISDSALNTLTEHFRRWRAQSAE
ncbi:MAG: anti-sigma factor family protein [Gemmatimonadaceae bacterium]